MATPKQIDTIHATIDNMMRDGKFNGIDILLKGVDVPKADPDILLSYLTATLPVRSKISYRVEFYKQVEQEFNKRKYEPELLKGLALHD